MIVLVAVLQDTPEGQLLAGLYNSANGSHPCRFCNCPGDEFHDDLNNQTSRDFGRDSATRLMELSNLERALQANKKTGQVTKARNKLKSRSRKFGCHPAAVPA
jgi:hypothetical protein